MRLRSRQSRRRLSRSTRSQSGPRPRPAQRGTPPPPRPGSPPPELASVTAPVDARWRLPARQRAGSGFLCSRHQVFPKSSPRGPPRPGAGGEGYLGPAITRPGAAGKGRWRLGLCARRSAVVRPPGPASGKGLGRAGQGQGRRAEPLGVGARVGARPLSLPGQRGFPRAREAAQEVEVFPKAVATRRWPPRGRRPRRRLLLLPLVEAQPPKRFQKTVLHGEGAGGEGPGFPS